MKRLLGSLILVQLLFNNAFSQQELHLVESLGVSNNSTSTNSMTERIKEAANKYQQYAPIPRIAQFDYAFASDLVEYEKLNGFGILYITSLNQDSDEYPIERVYFKYEEGVIDLKLIGSINIPVTNNLIKKVFGKNRIDYYYYLPYMITQLSGQLLVDWKKNRKDFLLIQFPAENKLEYITDNKKLLPDSNKNIDMTSFDKFAQREFQIKLNK
jgi:hypothetical protein